MTGFLTAPRPDGAATRTNRVVGHAHWLERRTQGPMPRGAVLLHAPAQVFQAPGGGEGQLVQTGRHLEALGLAARPFVPWVDRLEQARLVHLFGLSREGLELARVARASGVPVVVSPICWYEPRALIALAEGPTQAAAHLARWLAQRAWPRGLDGDGHCSPWPMPSCPTRGPRPNSSRGSSRSIRPGRT